MMEQSKSWPLIHHRWMLCFFKRWVTKFHGLNVYNSKCPISWSFLKIFYYSSEDMSWFFFYGMVFLYQHSICLTITLTVADSTLQPSDGPDQIPVARTWTWYPRLCRHVKWTRRDLPVHVWGACTTKLAKGKVTNVELPACQEQWHGLPQIMCKRT